MGLVFKVVIKAVVAICLLSGCGMYSVKLRREVPVEASRFRWTDARSPEHKVSGAESVMITSCAYGAYRMGDDRFTPDYVALLRSDLDKALGDQLAGKTLTLRTYLVHVNRALELRAQVSAMNSTSLLGALVTSALNDTAVHGCGAADLRGSYLDHEVKTAFSPLVVVIDLEVDGRPIHLRWVESPPVYISVPDDSSLVWNAWVTRVLFTCTEKLVVAIKASLEPAPSPSPAAATLLEPRPASGF